MVYRVDHIIHYLKNPNKIIQELSRFGLQVKPGGRHKNMGTYNSLAYLANCYIEWLGVFNFDLVKKAASKNKILEQILDTHGQEGIIQLGIRTEDIKQSQTKLNSLGLKTIGPIIGKRKKPNGQIISWQQLYLHAPKQKIQLPFIIQWPFDFSRQKNSSVIQSQGNFNPINVSSIVIKTHDKSLPDIWRQAFSWLEVFNGWSRFYQNNIKVLKAPNMKIIFIINRNFSKEQKITKLNFVKPRKDFHGININL